MDKKQQTILLGGIGGDSHSVGLTILRQALLSNGYHVYYLGTQNKLEEFFRLAFLSNIVMISNMDGHARHYLRNFPEMKKQIQGSNQLWYLGGNLVINSSRGHKREFHEMGFDRVFMQYENLETVLATLERDLHSVEAIPKRQDLWDKLQSQTSLNVSAVNDSKLELTVFDNSRSSVLNQWKTGPEAKNLEMNAEFLIRQPSFPEYQAQVKNRTRPMLVQPRSGVATVDEQIKYFQAFKNHGAAVLSYQVDSYTRNNDYKGAEEEILESKRSKSSTMNGFPVINHGVQGLRRIISNVRVPLQTRHSTRDPRLLAEISYAGGVTAFEGGCICYNIPYYRDYSLEESICTWQYVDRLTGLYFERFGITLDREYFGTLTGTLIPPSIAIVVDILEAIMAIQQGVKCVSLGYAEQGHRIQDIAAIRCLSTIASEIFSNLGYKDIQINTVFNQFMAAFPQDPKRAEELITESAITAALSGATRVVIKTPVEAFKIPSLADNLLGLNLVMRGVAMAKRQVVDEECIDRECELIKHEVNAIFDSIVLCGRGSIAEGIVVGFKEGYIDVPFSPSKFNRGEVMTVRDTEGAIRFLSTGNLQFDRYLRDFHRDKIQDRRRADGLMSEESKYKLVEKDVLQIAQGNYERWPLY
ncbi:MAG: methylaspartate mutase subunit E [Anaerolineales bacterium]|nr:methylaspartate mutase subunit E [Anaerolineales bacterium]